MKEVNCQREQDFAVIVEHHSRSINRKNSSQDNRCNKDFVLIVEERMMPMLYSAVSVERI